jgi:hypothetical protein
VREVGFITRIYHCSFVHAVLSYVKNGLKRSQREWRTGIALQSSRYEDFLGLVQCDILRHINIVIKLSSSLTSACQKHDAEMSLLTAHADKQEIWTQFSSCGTEIRSGDGPLNFNGNSFILYIHVSFRFLPSSVAFALSPSSFLTLAPLQLKE